MLSRTHRLQLLIALLVVAIGLVLLLEPIPQAAKYHQFADTRAFLGIPNFADVVSNAGFLFVGALGLTRLLRHRHSIFREAEHARPYLVFFASIFIVGFGSAYYHLAPTNDSLLWDRLPIAMAFMSISAALVADRIDARAGNGWLLAVMLAVGIASLVYWIWSESAGRGDLRFYVLVKFFPIVALPIIVWAFPAHYYFPGRFLAWIFAWHGFALLLEHFDRGVFELTGQLVSGHSLKHVAAAIATWMVYRMLRESRNGMLDSN